MGGRRSRARWTTTASGCRLRNLVPSPAPNYGTLAEVGETHTSNQIAWHRPLAAEAPENEWWMPPSKAQPSRGRHSSSRARGVPSRGGGGQPRSSTADSTLHGGDRKSGRLVEARRQSVGRSMRETFDGAPKIGMFSDPHARPPPVNKHHFRCQDKVASYQEASIKRTGRASNYVVMATQWPKPVSQDK